MKEENAFYEKLTPQERKAFDLAAMKHEGMTRKHGTPYFTHPLAVAKYLYERGYGTDYICTAFCHDLLEDTSITPDELLACCGEVVLAAAKLLSKSPGYVMEDYLCAIRKDHIAYAVKVADRIHNLKEARMADIQFQRQYLEETEEYYLDFAKESPFFEDLWNKYNDLKRKVVS